MFRFLKVLPLGCHLSYHFLPWSCWSSIHTGQHRFLSSWVGWFLPLWLSNVASIFRSHQVLLWEGCWVFQVLLRQVRAYRWVHCYSGPFPFLSRLLLQVLKPLSSTLRSLWSYFRCRLWDFCYRFTTISVLWVWCWDRTLSFCMLGSHPLYFSIALSASWVHWKVRQVYPHVRWWCAHSSSAPWSQSHIFGTFVCSLRSKSCDCWAFLCIFWSNSQDYFSHFGI